MRKPTCQFALLVLFVALSKSASACDLCCALCGTAEAETKVCRLVCSEKKLTVNCWSCEIEDICLPGPSHRTCRHCDVACDQECCHGCRGDWRKYFMWSEWTPRGSPMMVGKRKLMKRTVTKTIPVYKWVVEDLCKTCEAGMQAVNVAEDVLIPPAPAVENATIIGGHVPPSPK